MSLTTAVASAQEVETVVVTGSRIPQVGVYAASPVTAVNKDEIKYEGTTNVETLLNNLPSAFADFGSYESNGSPGTATVNLRNLGSARTLVLIDGKRLMPGDPILPSADLNQVPAALIDHVEVVTGGASAVYGSDAIAGVVNFIMRKDFEGFEFDGQWTGYQHDNDNERIRSIVAQGLGAAAPGSIPQAPDSVFDGDTWDLNGVLGVNSADGKGNITMYGGYRHLRAVTENTRDVSACGTATTGSGSFFCAGSGTTAATVNGRTAGGQFHSNNWVQSAHEDLGPDFWPCGTAYADVNGNGIQDPEDIWTPRNCTIDAGNGAARRYLGAPDQFNFAPLNYLQRPDERYTFGAMGHYEFNKMIDVYSSLMFMDDHTVAQIAPSGAFFGTVLDVNCDNPVLQAPGTGPGTPYNAFCGFTGGPGPDGTATLVVGRRNVEGGNRQDDLRHTSYRMVVGAKGDLGGGWAYDAFAQYGTTVYQEEYLNDASITRLQRALLVGTDDNGNPACFSALDGSDPGCVPWNIWTPGGVTAAQAHYFSVPGFKEGSTQEWVAGASLTGDLGEWGVQSPWSKSPVAIALGTEYRQEVLDLRTDLEFSSGDLAGQGGPTPSNHGGYNLEEGYAELRIPIAQDMPFFEDLTANAGYRYSSYSLSGSVESYKYGAEWQPIDDFRFRFSYQRAVRAPNVVELFTPQGLGLWAGTDPCAPTNSGAKAAVLTLEECERTGLTADQYAGGFGVPQCVSSQCGGLFGGNLGLQPETSDTWEYGVVLTPTFLEGFTATVDYFDISLKGAVGVVPQAQTILNCAKNIAPQFCQFIHRSDALGGAIFGTGADAGFVVSTNVNTGAIKTSGIDLEANYNTQLADWGLGPNGGLNINFLGTYTEKFRLTPFPGFVNQHFDDSTGDPTFSTDFYECAGLFGLTCGTPIPTWRHKMRVTWTAPWDFDFSLEWRHMSSVKFDGNKSEDAFGFGPFPDCYNGAFNPATAGLAGACDLSDGHIASYDYIDIAGDWTVREGISIHAGIQNLFDKDPPFLDSNALGVASPPFGNGNTFPQVYDALGRTVFVGVTVKY